MRKGCQGQFVSPLRCRGELSGSAAMWKGANLLTTCSEIFDCKHPPTLARFRPYDMTLYRAHSLWARITAQSAHCLNASCSSTHEKRRRDGWQKVEVNTSKEEVVESISLSLFGKPETWSVHQHQHRGNVLGGLAKGGRARLLGLLCDLCQCETDQCIVDPGSVLRLNFERRLGGEKKSKFDRLRVRILPLIWTMTQTSINVIIKGH